MELKKSHVPKHMIEEEEKNKVLGAHCHCSKSAHKSTYMVCESETDFLNIKLPLL